MRANKGKHEYGGVLPYFIVIIAAFLVLPAILWVTRDAARPPVVGGARAAERQANRAELQVKSQDAYSSYSVVNADEGIYQIPVEKAMETVVREWKQPNEALQQLADRVDRATALPPAPAEAPSDFE